LSAEHLAGEGTAVDAALAFAELSPETTRERRLVWQGEPGEEHYNPITRDTGRVLCEANVLYRGRRQATAEANLTAADSGKRLAHGIATCMILS